jgi:hypothetical protein
MYLLTLAPARRLVAVKRSQRSGPILCEGIGPLRSGSARLAITFNDRVATLREISRHLGRYPAELRGRGRGK